MFPENWAGATWCENSRLQSQCKLLLQKQTALSGAPENLFKVFFLSLRVDKEDVMTCLIKGCNFVLRNIPHEVFAYQKDSDTEFRFQTNHPNIFPYLLVNIGSGVSIVKVSGGQNASLEIW